MRDNMDDILSNNGDVTQEQDNTERKGVKNPKWTRIMREDDHLKDSVASFLVEEDLV